MTNNKEERRRKRWKVLLQIKDDFDKLYPTQISHIKALCELAGSENVDPGSEQGFKCAICGSLKIQLSQNSRILKCNSCSSKTCLTANTYFRGIKSPKAWNMIIEYLRRGIVINSKEFSKLAEIEESSAWHIITKIAETLSKIIEDSSSGISCGLFRKAISKRSLTTPALLSTSDEIDKALTEYAESHENKILTGQKQGTSDDTEATAGGDRNDTPNDMNIELSDNEKLVLRLLDSIPKSIDQLCEESGLAVAVISAALTILELYGLVNNLMNFQFSLKNEKRIQMDSRNFEESMANALGKLCNTGNDQNFRTKELEQFAFGVDQPEALAGAVGEFLIEKFSGVSRRYLQLYVVMYQVVEEKAESILHTLSSVFRQSAPPDRERMRAYDSPPVIMVRSSST